MTIDVIGIVFNNYGRFVDSWIKNIEKQNIKPDNVILVFGENHNYTGKLPDYVKTIYYNKKATMGSLRNLGLVVSYIDYILYFSIDDKLFSNAIEEIKKVNTDIVALKYIFDKNIYNTPKIEENKIKEWKNYYAGVCGYYAFKRGLLYDDTDFPNFPLLFNAYKNNYTFGITDDVCAEYLLRQDSHSNQGNIPLGFKEIEKYVKKYFNISG